MLLINNQPTCDSSTLLIVRLSNDVLIKEPPPQGVFVLIKQIYNKKTYPPKKDL